MPIICVSDAIVPRAPEVKRSYVELFLSRVLGRTFSSSFLACVHTSIIFWYFSSSDKSPSFHCARISSSSFLPCSTIFGFSGATRTLSKPQVVPETVEYRKPNCFILSRTGGVLSTPACTMSSSKRDDSRFWFISSFTNAKSEGRILLNKSRPTVVSKIPPSNLRYL